MTVHKCQPRYAQAMLKTRVSRIVRIRQQTLIDAPETNQAITKPPRSREERQQDFGQWLRREILAEHWLSKKEIREYAKNRFRVVRADADRIRTELANELCKDMLKPGRRKST
jgi:hypothetical protein